MPELLEWCNSLADENEDVEGRLELIQLFQRLAFVLRNEQDLLQFNDEDREFFTHVKANLIHDTDNTHLPIPVYSFVKPSNSIQFINHILLSLGRFSTEIDLMTHPSLKDCFRSAKLIGNNNDNESLQQYSNDLLVLYIKEQVRFFPNSMRVISDIIVKAGLIFESVLVKGEIPLTEMPPVIYSTLIRSIEEEIVQERRKHLERVIDAVMIEMEGLVQLYNLPSKNDLMNATLDNVLPWNPLQSFQRGPQQTEESYKEQKLVISTCMKAIDSYKNIQNQLSMVKSICIRGHPGAGKTFCMMYILLYVISQGLMNTPTAKMSRRALQLGGINWDKFLCLRGNDDKTNAFRRAELAIKRIQKNEKKKEFILGLNVIVADELGQLSAEELSTYDIILRHVRGSNIFLGGILLIGTLDHLQIQPINGRPFLIANSIIPCFKMVQLVSSVRAIGDLYVELQSLVRKDYIELESNPNLIRRFKEICSLIFTFVDTWDDERITSKTFRVFSKRAPALEALQLFQHSMIRKYNDHPSRLRVREAEDKQKGLWSHEWVAAEREVVKSLNQKCREPNKLLFEKGLVYTITFNDNRKSNSQKALLFDLPSQQQLDAFEPIKILLAPPGCKDIIYEEGMTKESFLERGFIETRVECSPQKIHFLTNNIQGIRKQYGLQHYVAGTIHSVMGDTLPSIATTFSVNDPNFSMWDKGQLLVIISRTRHAKDTIFVGEKNDTLNALVQILRVRTQWTDHMERILRVVTINEVENEEGIDSIDENERNMEYSNYPYRITDISLPNDTSGYVYMLISLRCNDFVYIGKTKDLNQRLRAHQSGNGSYTTQPEHLRPYCYFAYICGFDGNEATMFYIERQWKEIVVRMKTQGIHDPRLWACMGGNEVLNLNLRNFGIEDTRTELRLVLLFRYDI